MAPKRRTPAELAQAQAQALERAKERVALLEARRAYQEAIAKAKAGRGRR